MSGLSFSSSVLLPILNLDKNAFGSYLAGLIEGDGSIKVPGTERSQKGKKSLSFNNNYIC
jgi:hypothetical protein